MSHIFTYVRDALATLDVQSILEIPRYEITWRIETMVLPELSRAMAYSTRNTDNRPALP